MRPHWLGIFTILVLVSSVASADDAALARKAVTDLPAIGSLPNPLAFGDGTPVRTREDWERRRKEIKSLFETYVYGRLPPKPEKMTVVKEDPEADEKNSLDREEWGVVLEHGGRELPLVVTIVFPRGAKSPLPVIIQPSFARAFGAPVEGRARAPREGRPSNDRLSAFTRRGFAAAEFDFNVAAIDNRTIARSNGVFKLIDRKLDAGTLMAWAWGIHRVVDALSQDIRIDAAKIGVYGHGRYGKAALVAGAFDERIALTVASHSGCGGMSPFRFVKGRPEQLANVLSISPHWFREDFREFSGKVERLPVDQNLLAALVAPRALMAHEGTQDSGSGPEGAQLSYLSAGQVYEFLGKPKELAIRFRPTGSVPSTEDLLDGAERFLLGKRLPQEFNRLPFPQNENAIFGKGSRTSRNKGPQ
jgi:hypothetical protein